MSRALPSAAECRQILAEALAYSQGEQTEVRLDMQDESLTRFADSQVHQNVAACDATLTIRAYAGAQCGTASTHTLTSDALRATADRALALARLAPPAAHAPQLPGAQVHAASERFCAATAACTPEERAEALRPFFARVREARLDSAGALATATRLHAIANSAGLFAHHTGTHAKFTATVRGDDSSGWVAQHRGDWRDLDLETQGRIAIEKCAGSRGPRAVEPGKWTVILEPAAVAEMLQFLGPLTFGARAFLESRSAVSGRIGERVSGPHARLTDDAFDPRGFGCPFDEEGTPRKRLTLLDGGIARDIAHDRATAALAGTTSTGHAAPEEHGDGPLPDDLVLASGDASLARMISETERGLLVTRFWYVRVVDARRTLLTGMTRDGTFLIENGRLAGGVRNMRWNDSVLGTLERADFVGDTGEPFVYDWSGGCVIAPALRVRDFTFSSVSVF